MARYELADIEGYTMDDVTTVETLELFTWYISEHHHQLVIDGEGEALAPSSVLLDCAGVEVSYDRS
ncbi:hypothetical protein BH23PAT2_BH23PAT2_03890 [soil metagenome]